MQAKLGDLLEALRTCPDSDGARLAHLAESAHQEVVRLARERKYSGAAALLGPGEDILIDRPEPELGGVELAPDAVETGQQLDRNAEVGVGRGVGRAEFDPGRVRRIGVGRDAHRG